MTALERINIRRITVYLQEIFGVAKLNQKLKDKTLYIEVRGKDDVVEAQMKYYGVDADFEMLSGFEAKGEVDGIKE